ncbi:hypothetical protein, partial [Streptomyces sp. NPDC051994]|uniref:hypothetical protein n=1 Tax=Streptomyces sp. NPDC051994 TaxID=3155287 RepID=UPI003415C9A1
MSIVRRVALVVALSAAVIVPAAATAQAVPRVAVSKSNPNAVDPLDWMDNYGSDAVRFTLAKGAN